MSLEAWTMDLLIAPAPLIRTTQIFLILKKFTCNQIDQHTMKTRKCDYSNNTKRIPNHKNETQIDRISELPDEILSLILSSFTIKESAKTSILSNRWKSLWKISISSSSSINLDELGFNDRKYDYNLFGGYDGMRLARTEENLSLLRVERKKFVNYVGKILKLDHNTKKKYLRIRFYLTKDDSRYVDQCIKLAAEKRVEEYDIDLSPFHGRGECIEEEDLYVFPSFLFFEDLYLKKLRLNSLVFDPVRYIRFWSLTELRIEYGVTGEYAVVNILRICPKLEKLQLVRCRGLFSLDISGSSLKLKVLTICFCPSLSEIKIDCKSLVTFHYIGEPVRFLSMNVPQVSNVNLCYSQYVGAVDYALGKLSTDFPKLESLLLSTLTYEEDRISRQLPLFANLKKLVLMINLSKCGDIFWEYIPLIQASPNLQKLELHSSVFCFDCAEVEQLQRPCDVPHLRLKEISLTGFFGRPQDVEFVSYLLKNAISLQKMTVFYGTFNRDRESRELEEEMDIGIDAFDCPHYKLNRNACDHLADTIRPGVELEITFSKYLSALI